MNDLDYLNQISAGVSAPKSATPFFDKKMKTVLGIAVGAVIMIIILFAMTASTPKVATADEELGRIYNRSKTLLELIETYNSRVKSSSLRAAGSSLQTVLTELESGSETYMTSVYGLNAADFAMTAADTALVEGTSENLEKASLNGLLDRYYASEMSYQIAHLLIVENQALEKSSNADINSFLENSETSLNRLQETFSSYSESD